MFDWFFKIFNRSPKRSDPWHCHLCFPGAVEVKYFGNGLSLMYHEGKFHLVSGQGHEIFYTFEIDPYPDPDLDNLTPVEIDKLWEEGGPCDVWFDKFFEPFDNMKLSIDDGAWLGHIATKHGWKRGPLCKWWPDYCGKLVSKWKLENAGYKDSNSNS